MTLLEALLLGIVQGLTEFLPISSSGHLILSQHLFAIEEGGLTFDVALHLGTLLALVVMFWRDIVLLVQSLARPNQHQQLGRVLLLATIPAVITGVLLESTAERAFRSPLLVSFTLIIVGILMLLAERSAKNSPRAGKPNWRQGLMIGTAQATALIPGVSRSGATITAGLFAGLDRLAATRFSFLLAIPITAGAVLKVGLQRDTWQQVASSTDVFMVGTVASLLSGLVAINLLLKFVARHSLSIFAYYRCALAVLVWLVLLVA